MDKIKVVTLKDPPPLQQQIDGLRAELVDARLDISKLLILVAKLTIAQEKK